MSELENCHRAKFNKSPIEQTDAIKELGTCNKSVNSHFQTKLTLNFTFKPDKLAIIRTFFEQLDNYANLYDMEESKDFYYYPPNQPTIPTQEARNHYLNR